LIGGFLIEVVLENGFEAAIALGLYIQGPLAGRLQALVSVGLAKAHDAQHRPKALLGMGAAVHDGPGQALASRSGLGRPVKQTLGSPLEILPVLPGHVLGRGGVTALFEASSVAGHPFSLMEAFHGAGAEAHLQPLLGKLIRHRVIMAVQLDVVVHIYLGGFPSK
jgi:hypothetical protein